ncbi:MAG: ABC transporter ATP-binding protein [Kiritimatiellaeota bacterium]|nr:ABC transporter ATP-binding protein [Kiritimatiellota bacterium]
MSNALEIRGLAKSYGPCRALAGLDLDVPSGSLFGLVGANGAGKTTLMSICAGLLRPDAGRVDLLGEGAFDPQRHAGRVTILPQDSRLPLHARVQDLLAFYGRLQGVPADVLPRQVADLLQWVNLSDRARDSVKSLSHGMLRRLTVAQAFLGEPQLIFLDEPMSGLDPREVARLRDLLRARAGRQTIVISSHVLTELEILCDRVAFIDHGRLLRQDRLVDMVRHHQRVTYHIRPAPVSLAELRAAVPGAEWSVSGDGAELSVLLAAEHGGIAAVNARIRPVLLQAGVAVEEVRRGSALEREFLEATDAR